MKLVAYREFRPHEETTPRMSRLYGRMGITESFLRDVGYSGPQEMAWAFAARKAAGKMFARRLSHRLDGADYYLEERAKDMKRIIEKLARKGRSPGAETERILGLLGKLGLPGLEYPVGSVRDMYGVRVVIPKTASSRDDCYGVLEKAMDAAGIRSREQILSLVDYLAYPEYRFGGDGECLGRYESLQMSFIYLGVPVEVQIRDAEMDWNAKNVVKRSGLDR